MGFYPIMLSFNMLNHVRTCQGMWIYFRDRKSSIIHAHVIAVISDCADLSFLCSLQYYVVIPHLSKFSNCLST